MKRSFPLCVERLEDRYVPAVLSGSTPPVIPGPADPTTTLIQAAGDTIPAGSSTAITVIAEDAAGNPETTGGSTVIFGVEADPGQGTFSAVSDNGDGTYTVFFTGATAGAATITASIDGQTITTPDPTITVNPGPADPTQSTIQASGLTVQSGSTITVTLTAADANGNLETTGGSTVIFGLGAGNAQGTFSGVTDNGDGTYTATFTGTIAGSNTITASIDGQTITSADPSISVTPGAADPGQSTIQVSGPTVQSGSTITVTLTAADANGNLETTGGSSVIFGLGAGNAQGTFSGVTDNGDGTYTATFTGTIAGSNTITASIDGQTITSADPSISVTPGAADPGQSTIQVSGPTVQSGSTITVTLTAADANGNLETTGGSSVIFGLGAGNAQGTFSGVTDNGDGTYTATFTGTSAGSNTITASIDGQTITSTDPSISVTPGAADPGQSTIQVSGPTVQSGSTITVTLTAADANGNLETTGGSSVIFGLGAGNAQGTFSGVTDNGDGTYTATFTGTSAGSNTITASIDGQTITSTDPSISVTPGAADPGQSTLQVSGPTVQSGSTITVTLTAADANGNLETTGGSSVIFGLGAGNAQGTFSGVTDNGDGTYTATFTGTSAGSNTITASIDGQTITSTNPAITVTPGAADPGQSSVQVSSPTVQAGNTVTVTLTAVDAVGNQLTSGGSNVVFSLGGGDAQGTFSAVTDNGDGTYTATFTATSAGSTTITATIDGQSLTSAAPALTVAPTDSSDSGSPPADSTDNPPATTSAPPTKGSSPSFVIDPYLIDPNAPTTPQKPLFYVPGGSLIPDSYWLDSGAQSLVPPVGQPLTQ